MNEKRDAATVGGYVVTFQVEIDAHEVRSRTLRARVWWALLPWVAGIGYGRPPGYGRLRWSVAWLVGKALLPLWLLAGWRSDAFEPTYLPPCGCDECRAYAEEASA